MRKVLFVLTLSAGMLAACTADPDETAVQEQGNESVEEVTKEQVSAGVASTGEGEQGTSDQSSDDESAGEEVTSYQEAASRESVYYQPDILDEETTDEQWADVNSDAYMLPDHMKDAPGFASLEDFLTTLHESWKAESTFRGKMASGQFEGDTKLALTANTYLNYYQEEAAELGMEQEVQGLKEAAFNLHRNFYGSHQEKLNDSLRVEFEEHLNYVRSLFDGE